MILVSACLAGEKCRYNGEAFYCASVAALVAAGQAITVCPEVLGGLPTPRPPAEIVAGRVLTRGGADVTEQFHCGALMGLGLACQAGCSSAVLKARSPSCGVGQVYDGSFSGRLIAGDGIFAAMLKAAGIRVITEDQCEEFEGTGW
jgi:uncharacterized protein YbbK (DUF523 family)